MVHPRDHLRVRVACQFLQVKTRAFREVTLLETLSLSVTLAGSARKIIFEDDLSYLPGATEKEFKKSSYPSWDEYLKVLRSTRETSRIEQMLKVTPTPARYLIQAAWKFAHPRFLLDLQRTQPFLYCFSGDRVRS